MFKMFLLIKFQTLIFESINYQAHVLYGITEKPYRCITSETLSTNDSMSCSRPEITLRPQENYTESICHKLLTLD